MHGPRCGVRRRLSKVRDHERKPTVCRNDRISVISIRMISLTWMAMDLRNQSGRFPKVPCSIQTGSRCLRNSRRPLRQKLDVGRGLGLRTRVRCLVGLGRAKELSPLDCMHRIFGGLGVSSRLRHDQRLQIERRAIEQQAPNAIICLIFVARKLVRVAAIRGSVAAAAQRRLRDGLRQQGTVQRCCNAMPAPAR